MPDVKFDTAEANPRNPDTAVNLATGLHKQVRVVESSGVVGAGTMGVGIAIALLTAGFPVTLLDSNVDVLARATSVAKNYFDRSAEKGRISSSRAELAIRSLSTTTQLEDFKNLDLVIEAVFENMAVKQDIFRRLDRVCKTGTILATNTSTLSVDQIAEVTQRPGDVIGLHFFSPAHIMPLIEIVRTKYTLAEVSDTAMDLSEKLGKVGVCVGNCYGFVGNRMIEGFCREANYMILEGMTPKVIDRALTSFGYSMGPLAVADLVGIDVPYRARQENSQAIAGDDSYYRMADVLMEHGWLGQKTGCGYYCYGAETQEVEENVQLQRLASTEAERFGVDQRKIPEEEIVERCVFASINEGANILLDGIASCTRDIDVIAKLGYGFPSSIGGPMRYADTLGLPVVLARIREFEQLYGAYWTPSPLLKTLEAEGRSFYDFS